MNISVIGSRGLSASLAKKGTVSDIALYNTSFQSKYFTFVEPEIYPEKVQTLFQAVAMSQFTILYVKRDLPRNILGECILALDMLKPKGALVLDGIEKEEVLPLLAQTALSSWPVLENNTAKIMEFLASSEPAKIAGSPKVVIDHAFNVKGVGTVALGTVLSGEIKKYEKMTLFPVRKEVVIKSIQIHDKDHEKADCWDRVGLCLKGVEADELKRGYIIADNMATAKEMEVVINKNKFFKDEMPKGLMCIFGMQYVRADLEGNKLMFESDTVVMELLILLAPEKKMRIVGSATRK